MNRFSWVSVAIALVATVLLVSCLTESELVGLWQSTDDEGTIEFKSTGEVVVTDNMAATVTGRYEVEEDGSLRLELTGSDILGESVRPMPEAVIEAHFELKGDELTLLFYGGSESESYRRIR
jgi:hypothetical protein